MPPLFVNVEEEEEGEGGGEERAGFAYTQTVHIRMCFLLFPSLYQRKARVGQTGIRRKAWPGQIEILTDIRTLGH